MRAGKEWDELDRMAWWLAYYQWLEPIIWQPGRWALLPDSPGAPSQINDGLLNDWPFGHRGVPVYHMDAPIERLGRLCERFPRVALGWIGDPKREPVGCSAYQRKMEQVARLMGNTWHPLHMLRGTAVAFDYPFISADSTSLAQNGWRYDAPLFNSINPWVGRQAYADRLETPRSNRSRGQRPRFASVHVSPALTSAAHQQAQLL
ncbi:hypothetical protein [Sphingobium sp. B1D7B]|uniref:hypothetical protein n=1 Tax=Sphingobium sp. B1D7B TaxID=2940578 RepID=UPI0022244D73|nr:hypothetical protein [Sphingobium sp. B1D7B]